MAHVPGVLPHPPNFNVEAKKKIASGVLRSTLKFGGWGMQPLGASSKFHAPEDSWGGKYFPPTVGTCVYTHIPIPVEGCPKHVEDPLHLGLTVYKITRSVWWEKTSLRLLSEWLILVAHSINAAVRQSQPCKFFFSHCAWLLS